MAALSTLQEKARGLVENPKGLDANVVQLVEDLARVGNKIVDEARREREDLKQQVCRGEIVVGVYRVVNKIVLL